MKRRNYKKIAIILVVLWGAVLAVGGAINGNHAIITPDLEKEKHQILEKQISSNALNCWIVNNRSGYALVEFAEEGRCSTELQGAKRYTCLDSENLQNLQWIRSTFKKLDRQLILYNQNPEQNLQSAALLSYYGYNVRMLTDTADIAKAEPVNQRSLPASNHLSEPSPVTPVSVSDDFEEEMEEEEEEGC